MEAGDVFSSRHKLVLQFSKHYTVFYYTAIPQLYLHDCRLTGFKRETLHKALATTLRDLKDMSYRYASFTILLQ